MFDGTGASRQSTRRGGSKQLSRTELIQRARAERVDREQLRREASAAARLQAWWRGELARGGTRSLAAADIAAKRSTFDAASAQMTALFASQGKTFPGIVPPAAALAPMLRYAAASSLDAGVATWVAQHLTAALQRDGKESSSYGWLACAAPWAFVAQVGSFFRFAVAATSGDTAAQTIVEQAITTVLSPSTWALAGAGHAQWGVEQASAACVAIAQQSLLHGGIAHLSPPSTLLAIAAAAVAPGPRPVPGDVWQAYARTALSSPALAASPAHALPDPSPARWTALLGAVDSLLGGGAEWAPPRLFSLAPTRPLCPAGTASGVLLQNLAAVYVQAGDAPGAFARGASMLRCVQRLLTTIPLFAALRQGGAPVPAASVQEDLSDSDWEYGEEEGGAAAPAAPEAASLVAQLSRPIHLAGYDPSVALATAALMAQPGALLPGPQGMTAEEREGAKVVASGGFLARLAQDVLGGGAPGPERASTSTPTVQELAGAALDLGQVVSALLQGATLAAAWDAQLCEGRPPSVVRKVGRSWLALRQGETALAALLGSLGSACSGNFVPLFWQALSAAPALDTTSPRRTIGPAVDSSTGPALCAALGALSAVALHRLRTLPDADLLEGGGRAFMPLRDLAALARTLNAALYQVGWVGEASRTLPLHKRSLQDLVLLVEGGALYRHLYERHGRHPGELLPGAAWLWPRISATDLSSDIMVAHHTGAAPPVAPPADPWAALTGAAPTLPAGAATGAGEEPDATSTSPQIKTGRALFVLTQLPMTVPFKQRAALFADLLAADHAEHQSDFGLGLKLRIRREALLADSMSAFAGSVASHGRFALKERMQITFISADGHEEAGIDGGGVFKEWIDAVTSAGFGPDYGMFTPSPGQELYPNPSSGVFHADHLDHFVFLGRLLGKAVYEGVLVEPVFAGFFLNKVLGKANLLDDLQSLDGEVYGNLMKLRGLSADTVSHLGLTFETSVPGLDGPQDVEVVRGGAEVGVTSDNLLRYIAGVAHLRLNTLISAQTRAFLSGFRDVIPVEWVRMFSPAELQLLIGGSPGTLDVGDMRANTVYAGGYHNHHPVIEAFWQVLEEDFTPEDSSAFLMFLTSCSRPPLLGFSRLTPKLAIHRVPLRSPEEAARLPTSATCMNLLKLPEYPDKALLRDKLRYAIHSASGFELS